LELLDPVGRDGDGVDADDAHAVFLPSRPLSGATTEGARTGPSSEMADGRAWQDGRVRGLLVPSEGKYPDAQPLRGMREDRGAPGPLAREPSLVSRRAVPAPVRRLAFFAPVFAPGSRAVAATPVRAGTARSPTRARRPSGSLPSLRWLRCYAPSRRRRAVRTIPPRRAAGTRRPGRRASTAPSRRPRSPAGATAAR